VRSKGFSPCRLFRRSILGPLQVYRLPRAFSPSALLLALAMLGGGILILVAGESLGRPKAIGELPISLAPQELGALVP